MLPHARILPPHTRGVHPLLCSLLVLLVVAVSSTCALESPALASVQTLSQVSLRVITTPVSDPFARRSSLQYQLQRPGEVQIDVHTAVSQGNLSPNVVGFQQLARGEADAAFLPHTMSDADHDAAPDVIAFPLWATAFAPIYNVPEMGRALVLSTAVLAKIYAGNITRWNHASLVALNPGYTLPNQPIELVLQADPLTLSADFVRALRLADPLFTVPVSTLPAFPTARYARFSSAKGLNGPASAILARPYTLGVAIVSVANKIGTSVAALINPAGEIVRPTFLAISAALSEMAVKSYRDAGNAEVVSAWSNDLVGAPGSRAWPLVYATSLFIPRTYSRQGCRTRSELAKYLRWMLQSDSVRYGLAASESVALLTADVDAQLGLTAFLSTGLRCETVPVNTGDYQPILIGGVGISSAGVDTRDLMLNIYSARDPLTDYNSAILDESLLLERLTNPLLPPDMGWIFVQSHHIMYPGDISRRVANKEVTVVNMAVLGVVPCFRLPDVVLARHRPTVEKPVFFTMELMADIFLGGMSSWLDRRMLEINPQLEEHFAGEDPTVTLVFCGRGLPEEAPLLAISNHFLIAMNTTAAFKADSLKYTLPANFTGLAERLTARGIPFVHIEHELDMEATVARIPGAIGYKVGSTAEMNPETDFAVWFPFAYDASKPNDFTYVQINPNPRTLTECASNSQPSRELGWLIEAITSPDPKYDQCWPFVMLLALVLPRDRRPSVGEGAGTNVEALCFRHSRVTKFAQWLAANPSLVEMNTLAGRAMLSGMDNWRTDILAALDEINCNGQPVLWTPAVVWKLSHSVSSFGMIVSLVGLVLSVLAICVLIYYRHRTVVRVASLWLQLAVLLGLLLLFPAPWLYAHHPPSTSTCGAFAWLTVLGVSLTFAPMCLKIYRVHRAHAQRRALKIRPLRSWVMAAAVAALVALDIAVLISAQTKGGLSTPLTRVMLEGGGAEHHYTMCSVPDEVLPEALIVASINFVMLLWGALTAFGVRNVASAFRESTHLSWALWNVVVSAAIIVPLLLLVQGGLRSDMGVFLLCFYMAWSTFGALLCAFAPRFMLLISEDLAARRNATSTTSRSGATHTSGTGTRSGTRSGGSAGTGTDTSGATASLFNLPSIELTSLSLLEKYITALEGQLRMAREKRKREFGATGLSATGDVGKGSRLRGDKVSDDEKVSSAREDDLIRSSSPSRGVSTSSVSRPVVASHAPQAASRQPIRIGLGNARTAIIHPR